MSVQIIMLSGWAGSGKDTTANYLVKNKGFVRMAFADALKNHIAKERNIPREWMDSLEGKSRIVGDKTVREYLIQDGQSAREKDPEVWIKVVMKNIRDATASGKSIKVVISDWRLPNEYTVLKREFDSVVRVRVNRFERPPIDDYTETALDKEPFEVTLDNTSTTEKFEDLLRSMEWEKLFP